MVSSQMNPSQYIRDYFRHVSLFFLGSKVFIDPVFATDDIDVPRYDSPTKVNLFDTSSMHDYWSRDPDIITVNIVEIDKDDPTAICG